jgi:hypothetical protein
MASNIDDIDRMDDGTMMASSWRGYACKDCGCYHMDLLDREGNVFASLVIGEEDLFVVADKLMDVAERQLMSDCEAIKLH